MNTPGMPFLPQNLVPLMPILDALRDGILIVDASGIVLAINKALRQFYQGSEIPFPGYPLSDFNAADWVEVKRVLASGQPRLNLSMTLPAATVIVNRVPLVREGAVVGVVCSLQDVTWFDDIIGQLAGYRKLDTTLDGILEQCPQPVLVTDPEGVILRANSASGVFCGSERETLIGRNIADAARDPADIGGTIRDCAKSGNPQVSQRMSANGSTLLILASPAKDEQGITRFVVAGALNLDELDSLRQGMAEPVAAISEFTSPEEEENAVAAAMREAGLVARSKTMLQVVQRTARVSQTESSVLLQGESGVGKSMLASLIHRLSPRSKGPFVTINCGAIPEQLMESELFGYERGAFTGAAPNGKTGLIESGNGGTVFFDEIGELGPPMQVKLLEAIDRKAFLRVGGTRQISVDFRIVAATNRNLEEEVARGAFRKDLFYRLNVIPIDIPPLRERREDIMAMALGMLARHNASGAPRKKFSPEVVNLLLRHDFPGNARELNNAMEWMLVMSEGNVLHPEDMPAAFRPPAGPAYGPLPETDGSLSPLAGLEGKTLKDALDAVERFLLHQTLDRHATMQEAARSLGVHPTTLWRKLTQHGLAGRGKTP